MEDDRPKDDRARDNNAMDDRAVRGRRGAIEDGQRTIIDGQ